MIALRLALLMVLGVSPGCALAPSKGDVIDQDGDNDPYPEDCDPGDPSIHHSATDLVDGGVDQNCDGVDGTDADRDGVASEASGGADCDDDDSGIAEETTWYDDHDEDGYGDPGDPRLACTPDPEDVANDDDCDDGDPAINPDTLWYADRDGDDYGDPADTTASCEQPEGYVTDASDCAPNNADINPAALEVCNTGTDDDCDGLPTPCTLGLHDDDVTVLEGVNKDALGGSAISIGDVTGEGQVDLMVTAKQDLSVPEEEGDEPTGGAGAAWLIAGPVPSGTSTLALDTDGGVAMAFFHTPGSEDRLGTATSIGANLDGDDLGCGDVVLSAYAADYAYSSTKTYSNAGAVYLYFGCFPTEAGPSYTSTGDVESGPDMIIYGSLGSQAIGRAVDASGDLDGSGAPDLVVTTQRYNLIEGDTTIQHVGAAAIFLGGAGSALTGVSPLVLTDADLLITGEVEEDAFGDTVRLADVDGDGLDNLAVGCAIESSTHAESGAVYLMQDWLVGTVSAADLGMKFTGIEEGERLGQILSSADLDDDGYADLLIGAPGANAGGANSGAVYAVLGADLSTGTATLESAWTFGGTSSSQGVGYSVASGDQDGDGVVDLLVGAAWDDQLVLDGGGAYLFYGPIEGSHDLSEADVVLAGEVVDDVVGAPVAFGGDLLGDGGSDILLSGTQVNSNDVRDAGVVYIVSTIGD